MQFVPDGVRPRFNVMGRLIGNAVPVLLGDAIAWSFECHLKQLEELSMKPKNPEEFEKFL